MNRLDRIVVRALLGGHVVFDDHRFASIGQVKLYRPVVGSCRWGLLFGHTSEDYGIDLGLIAHSAMMIAMRYRQV